MSPSHYLSCAQWLIEAARIGGTKDKTMSAESFCYKDMDPAPKVRHKWRVCVMGINDVL